MYSNFSDASASISLVVSRSQCRQHRLPHQVGNIVLPPREKLVLVRRLVHEHVEAADNALAHLLSRLHCRKCSDALCQKQMIKQHKGITQTQHATRGNHV